jgi:LemA protein
MERHTRPDTSQAARHRWRRFFNNAVQEYNTGIQQIPAAFFASALGFHPQPIFDLGETRAQLDQDPNVKF